MIFHDNVISIVAGGWSVNDVDLDKLPGTVIAVNDSAYWLPQSGGRTPPFVVSMDRLWVEYRWGYLTQAQITTYIRASVLKNVDWQAKPWLRLFECTIAPSAAMSPYQEILNGDNSGRCAMNLAYTMKPTELYLFGFDMCRSPDRKAYWHPPYPWSENGATKDGKYRQWAGEFKAAAFAFEQIGCKVFNVAPHSAITDFTRVSARDIGIGK